MNKISLCKLHNKPYEKEAKLFEEIINCGIGPIKWSKMMDVQIKKFIDIII